MRHDRGGPHFEHLGGLLCVAALLVIFKLVLVSSNEIIAIPDDSAGFVRLVVNGLGDLGPPVGYPLWLWLVKQTGIPQRIAIELLYCLASVCVVLSLSRSLGLRLSLLALVALVLNPATYFLFDHALSDPLFLCLTLFGISVSVLLLRDVGCDGKTRLVWALLLGLALGAMVVTRNESPLALAWMTWLALLMFLRASAAAGRRGAVKATFKAFLAMAVIFATMGTLPKAWHYASQGVWTSAIATMPSHMDMLHALASIDTGSEDPRYVAISRQARLLAYETSPTLRTLQPYVERSENVYVRASHDFGGLPEGEIGSGWVWHVFNDAALHALTGEKKAAQLDALWRQVKKEVDTAFASGKLKKRLVLHPFLGAGIARPLSTLPQGMWAVFDRSLRFIPPAEDLGFIAEIFDAVCNRRPHLLLPVTDVVRFQGWAFVNANAPRLLKVEAGQPDAATGTTRWVDLGAVPRLDVNAAFSTELGRPIDALGFKGEIEVPKGAHVLLRYATSQGDIVVGTFALHQVEKKPLPSAGATLYTGVDSFQRIPMHERWWRSILAAVAGSGGWHALVWIGGLVLVAPFALLPALRKRPDLVRSVPWLACLLVAGLALQRLAFYGLIHENAWSIEAEPRYVSSIFAMLVIALVCLAASLLRVFGASAETSVAGDAGPIHP